MTKLLLNIGTVVYVAIIVGILSFSPVFKQVNRTGLNVFGLPPFELFIIISAALLTVGFIVWYLTDAITEKRKNEWNERGR